jgi:hypothetical protein
VPEPMTTRVINFWAGPGAGKTTAKAGTFFLMKALGEKAVQIEEYATERSVVQDWATLADQRKVTFKQEKRQRRFKGKVNWIVTDSPLPLGCIYGTGEFATQEFRTEVWKLFNDYANVNIFIERDPAKPYQRYARHHDADEAIALDARIREMCHGMIHLSVLGDQDAPAKVVAFLRDRYKF